jgi:hypothetical protein
MIHPHHYYCCYPFQCCRNALVMVTTRVDDSPCYWQTLPAVSCYPHVVGHVVPRILRLIRSGSCSNSTSIFFGLIQSSSCSNSNIIVLYRAAGISSDTDAAVVVHLFLIVADTGPSLKLSGPFTPLPNRRSLQSRMACTASSLATNMANNNCKMYN